MIPSDVKDPHRKSGVWNGSRSRQIVWLALLIAASLGGLAASFIAFESGALRQNQLNTVALHARTLNDQVASVVDATEGILKSLKPVIEHLGPSGNHARLTSSLEDSLRGRPFLRSLSWLDEHGRVIASSNRENLGLNINFAKIETTNAPSPQPGVNHPHPTRARLLSVASGRDLADFGSAPLERAQILVLPMIQSLQTPAGTSHLLALLNPDYFATQFDRALNGEPLRAFLLGLDGRLILGSSNVDIPAGTSLSHLAAFRKHLPTYEFASEISDGADKSRVLSAFRVTRDWPLMIQVEQSYEVYLDETRLSAAWVIAFVLTSWIIIAFGTILSRRALLHDEQSRLDLASAHAATQASESRKLAILQSSLDAIVTIDGAGRVIEFNRAAEHLFGYPAAQAQGKLMDDLIVPEHLRVMHREGMTRYQAHGTARVLNRRIEIEACHADGTVFPVELTIVPIQSETGQLFTATLRDIRARRQAEEELGAARRRELQIGVQIQHSLLMTTTPTDLAGLRISSHSQASKGIDGDFLEIIRIGPHCVDIITGDVMGKGLAAALMGAATKMQFSRSIAELVTQSGRNQRPPAPAEIVAAVHRAMTPALLTLEAFVTLCYTRIDTEHDLVTWVGCGHEETILLPAVGPLTTLANQHPPLGVLPNTEFRQDQCALRAGDALFLYSDGLTDAHHTDGDRVGRRRVAEAVFDRLRAHATPAAALHAVRRDLLPENDALQDDLTMVVIQRQVEIIEQPRTPLNAELPACLHAVRQVRELIDQHSQDAGFSEDQQGLLTLACVEAFTNITRHATGMLSGAPIELIVHPSASQLTVELVHLGDDFKPSEAPACIDFDAYPEGGFGMQIIRAASDHLEYRHHRGVNSVRISKQCTRLQSGHTLPT